MTVLVVEPGKAPYVKDIDGLEQMQALVGGYIEAVYPFDDPIGVVLNEQGKLLDLPPNRLLYDRSGIPYDVICGTFFVAGLGEEDFVSLTPAQIDKYRRVFW